MNVERPWTAYRTRFVVHARQLTNPLAFTDALGREHSGKPGDYLVESSDGLRRITPRHLFEDIYVPLQASGALPAQASSPDRSARFRRPDHSSAALSPSPWVQTSSGPAKGGLVRST
jgi:hypothetical protein